MASTQRVTADLPEDLLRAAMEVTGLGVTETLVIGLRLVRQSRAHGRALALKGRVRLDIDLAKSRERRRR
jgi:hypothetical protein